MSEMGHDLHNEFPSEAPILQALKLESAPFRELAHRYHGLVREIGQIEAGLEAASDERLEGLKKQRLVVLDGIASLIVQRKSAS
jgi:uncharacterized protein YdcH (DUF465 family)